MNEYISEGERSFFENGERYINPYKPGSNQFNDFERGRFQALKRAAEQLKGDHRATEKILGRKRTALSEIVPTSKREEVPDDILVMLAKRAREKLLNDPLYQPPRYGWGAKVYYIRIETNDVPLWKIGVTSNDIHTRYCIEDRRNIVEIKSWHYATREEAEAIEREVLAEFADDVYDGGPVLRSGGDSELFTRDVLKLDSQNDFLAMARRERQASVGR